MIKTILPLMALGAAGIFYLMLPGKQAATDQPALVEVTVGKLEAWVQYEGALQSRDEQSIHSKLSQPSVITDLAEEGLQVKSGDLLVAFDPHSIQRDLYKLEEAFVLAEADYESLIKAELPMKLAELERNLKKFQLDHTAEMQFLEDSLTLHEKDLVSYQELARQERVVDALAEQVKDATARLELTRTYIHPSIIRRGEASLRGARQQRDLALEQLAYCRIVADRPGTVVYQPLHINGEYRTVKVGDSVYRNQRFMMLSDMSDLIVRCEVPEAQLADVALDKLCEVTPAAFPSLRLPGKIASIGNMAHSLAARPAWQKFFTVSIRLDQGDTRLRSGMSIQARVRSVHKAEAILAPRRAFSWIDGQAYCLRQVGDELQRTEVLTAPGNASHLEVVTGLEPGDLITSP